MNWYESAKHFSSQNKIAQNVEPTEVQAPEKEPGVYNIPEYKLGELEKKIFGLNKVAAKIGAQPIVIDKISREMRPDPSDETGMGKIAFIKIRITGAVPVVTNQSGQRYEFIGRITHTDLEGQKVNVINTVPGKSLPPSYRTVEPICQHCHKKRRRNDTFVLQDPDTQQFIQVGRNCLKDFTNNESVENIARWAELIFALNEEAGAMESETGFGGGGRTRVWDIEHFLSIVNFVANAHGWLSRAKAQETGKEATVSRALTLLTDPKAFSESGYKHPTDADLGTIRDAIEWAKSLRHGGEAQTESLSDYLWNLSIACSQGIVDYKNAGIVASLMIAYKMNVLDKIQPTSNEVVGNRGSHFVDSVVLIKENPGGTQTSYVGKTADNKLVSWWSEPLQSAVGAKINIEGFVSGFKRLFEGVTTTLIGVKTLNDEEVAAKKEQVNSAAAQPIPEYKEGEKFTTDLVLQRSTPSVNSFSGQDQSILNFTDRAGNSLTCFYSGTIEMKVGESANITATVKKVGQYNGKPQIQFIRPKINSKELRKDEHDMRMTPKEMKQAKSLIDSLYEQEKQASDKAKILDEQVYKKYEEMKQEIPQVVNSVLGTDVSKYTSSFFYSNYNFMKEAPETIQKLPFTLIDHVKGDIQSMQRVVSVDEEGYKVKHQNSINEIQNKIQKTEEELNALQQDQKNNWYNAGKIRDLTFRLQYAKDELERNSKYVPGQQSSSMLYHEGSAEWLADVLTKLQKYPAEIQRLQQILPVIESKQQDIINASMSVLERNKPEIEKITAEKTESENSYKKLQQERNQIQERVDTAKMQAKQYGKKSGTLQVYNWYKTAKLLF